MVLIEGRRRGELWKCRQSLTRREQDIPALACRAAEPIHCSMDSPGIDFQETCKGVLRGEIFHLAGRAAINSLESNPVSFEIPKIISNLCGFSLSGSLTSKELPFSSTSVSGTA
jgi:hypothetical protein